VTEDQKTALAKSKASLGKVEEEFLKLAKALESASEAHFALSHLLSDILVVQHHQGQAAMLADRARVCYDLAHNTSSGRGDA
jgi:hypothetical protein